MEKSLRIVSSSPATIEIVNIVNISIPYLDRTCSQVVYSVSLQNDEQSVVFRLDNLISHDMNACLNLGPVTLQTKKEISVEGLLEWSSDYSLTLISQNDIRFRQNAKIITSSAKADIALKAGIENPEGKGNVIFEDQGIQINMLGRGHVHVYYNPEKGQEYHKYHNPSGYFYYVTPNADAYMLVNSAEDLKHMYLFPSGRYALSQNIDASSITKPVFNPNHLSHGQPLTFFGELDGNDYEIKGFSISDPEDAGLFGIMYRAEIRNLKISNATVVGKNKAGILCGSATISTFKNINITNVQVEAPVAGALCGHLKYSRVHDVNILDNSISGVKCNGSMIGYLFNSIIENSANNYSDTNLVGCASWVEVPPGSHNKPKPEKYITSIAAFALSCQASDMQDIKRNVGAIAEGFQYDKDDCMHSVISGNASSRDKISALNYLIDQGAKLSGEWSLITWAVMLSDLDLLQFLIAKHEDPNGDGGVGLTQAILQNQTEAVFHLLRANATISGKVLRVLKHEMKTVPECLKLASYLQKFLSYNPEIAKVGHDKVVRFIYQTADPSCTIFNKSLLSKYNVSVGFEEELPLLNCLPKPLQIAGDICLPRTNTETAEVIMPVGVVDQKHEENH